eukprot:TRINITY_DN369_c0_g1_i2.p2 TRINITY_DN369_c0_g1~~TRINITY_DN369_c0_g1_i2.p2  ORF type:complete len:221 (-),score=28.87 TRINITY_DN369_c0_g1_i2:325-987(-)
MQEDNVEKTCDQEPQDNNVENTCDQEPQDNNVENMCDQEPQDNNGIALEREQEDEESPPSKMPKLSDEVRLGFKTFHSGTECYQYFNHILIDHEKGCLLNEYEHKALLDLLNQGHHNPESKVGVGVKGFMITKAMKGGHCFYVVQQDGTAVDFSYIKCIQGLFPDWESSNARGNTKETNRRGGGRSGRAGGRGRFGGSHRGRASTRENSGGRFGGRCGRE